MSRARQIRVRFKFRFEFDIQNAENIHDMGNLNTQWNKVRDAQRTKTTLGRNKQKEHERLCFFFFHFIVLWGGPYVGRYIQAWGPIKAEAPHPRPTPMSLPMDAHCTADTCVPSMYGWVRLHLQLLRFVFANVV